MKKYMALLLCLVMMAALLAGCGSAAAPAATAAPAAEQAADPAVPAADAVEYEKVSIKMAHTAADSHIFNQAMLKMAENVSERSGGNVTIDVFANGELGDATTLVEQTTLGAVDMTYSAMGYIATYMPKVNAMNAPFLFESYDQAHKVIDGFLTDWINADSGADMNCYALGIFDYGFRQVTTKGIEVNTADDLEGIKIRVPPTAGLQAAFDALGSNTQTIAYSELYTSLKQGVVDAQENPVGTILADCLYECQDQLAITNHFFDCQALMINKDKWDSLSPAVQELLAEEAANAMNMVRDYVTSSEEDTIAQLKEQGMNVTYPDISTFVAKMDPAYKTIGDLAGQENMTALLDAIKQYS